MVQPRRIERLRSLIKERVAEILMRDIRDPRLGFITITDVQLDRELAQCKVYWSVLGDEAARRHNARALDHAARFVQREVAEILPTRTVPRLQFVFDESIAGAIRVQKMIDELNRPGADEKPDSPAADSEDDSRAE